MHEHQRQDREQYVHFECANLNGYRRAKELLPQYFAFTMHELCASAIYTQDEPWYSLGFTPFEWSTWTWWDRTHKDANGNDDGFEHMQSVFHAKPYDYDSIMHYGSEAGTSVPFNQLTVQNAPLIRWKQGREGYQAPSQATDQNAQLIIPPFGRGPSDGDFEFVQKLYPWAR
ncbi:hypothetical protein FB567DRAFT_574381 [Paraphoma chrysanthemicola]|uniref:Metalloendopeptidase n=1 Tax=Paraphoma chrysanthemicola TaxID=798071 RepID=A0A8K0RI98_9PLEO|nr:hypothetical protein FB567DRAFT_574381 [Paraphoma chrysanthemicola]